MTEKSEAERIDLNSDVVSSDPETEVNGVKNKSEALMEVNRLNGENGVLGSVVDGEKDKVEDGVKMGDGKERTEGANDDCAGKVGVAIGGSDTILPSVEKGVCEESGKGVELVGNGKEEEGEVAFEAEKEEGKGKGFDEMERGEHVEKGVVDETLDKGASFSVNPSSNLDETGGSRSFEALGSVSDVVKAQSLENSEAGGPLMDDVPVVEVEKKIDPDDECLPQRVMENEPSDLEAPGSVSDVVKPQSPETTESGGRLMDDVPVAEVEKKVDPDKSLPQRELKNEPSHGIQKEALNLKVHLEAQTKGNSPADCLFETPVSESTGNESNSINIVIDLSPRMNSIRNVKSTAFKPDFAIGDLVWGKVRSHPWWPGQICDPASATRKAKKYFKKDGYLIAYFGDHTFAWNDTSMIKPFLKHFSQMETLSNTEDFHYATACVLEEVSRRVEFGLACSCISEEVYANLKSQMIINAGIREDSSKRDGGDRSLTVGSFEPIKLIEYIKELAQVPYDGTDKLELAIARSQLLAFNRKKGYSQLPEFDMLGGLLENDTDILPSGDKKHCNEVSKAVDPEQKDDGSVSVKGKSKIRSSSSLKRKLTSEDSALPRKKEKILKDLIEEKLVKTPTSESGSESKVIGKKRKADKAMSDDLPLKRKEKKSPVATGVDNNNTPQPKQTFRVGESIRRVASQLNGSSLILKNLDGMSISPLAQTKSKDKIKSEESKTEKLKVKDSPDEMRSQLCSAARDPTSVKFSKTTFFSEFRNTVSSGLPSSEDDEEPLERLFGSKTRKKLSKSGRKSNKPGITELPPSESMKESYWSERIVRSIPDPEDQNETGEPLRTSEKENVSNSAIESQKSLESDVERQIAGENLENEEEKPVDDHSNDNCTDDSSPTALILNFTDLDSVPSSTNLNKIFSRYGPLNESDTEVFKKKSRAKVVFRRRSDAETAFSSAGKYSTFGPSLVSYRLKYIKSTPSKASPNSKKQYKTEAESAEDTIQNDPPNSTESDKD